MYYCALPPAMNESFYCSTSCQHLVLLVFWILVILIGVQWYLVLVCISLMTYDVEQLFIYLITISVSPLMGCLLRSLVCFLIILFIFLLMSFKSSLYIFDNSLLSDVSFVNISSQPMTCLTIFFTVFFSEQKIFIAMKSSL